MGVPKPPFRTEDVRAQFDLEPVSAKKLLPAVSQTKTVTKTGGDQDEQLKDYIQPYGKKLIDELLALAFNESTKDTVKLNVINSLLDRGFGKPSQTVETNSATVDLTSLHFDALKNVGKK